MPDRTTHKKWTLAILPKAILIACMSYGLVTSGAYAEPVKQSDAIKQYAISSGNLDNVLNQFAIASGIMLTINGSLTQGLSSKGLTGHYTIQSGLYSILSGTQLQAIPQGNNRYTIEQFDGIATLSTLEISGQVLRSSRDSATEGTGSYAQTGASNTATRLGLTLRETPQTVSVISRQQMDDFGMTSVDDAMKSVSGVYVANEGNNGSTYFSRGFNMQAQYDGVANPAGLSNNNLNPQVDNAFFDRVEVLQGPAGLMSGSGTPGGVVNLIRKRPTHDFQASTEVQLSSWDGRRLVGDISTPLLESGSVRGRLVAVIDDRNSFIDHAYRDRNAIYGIVEADLTDATTIAASVQYQEDDGRNHFGVPFSADGRDAGLSRSSYFGDANARTIKDYTLYTVDITHQLANDWQFKAAYMYGKTNNAIRNYSYISGGLDVATGDGILLNRMRSLDREFIYDAVDAHISGPLQLWGREHELAFGLNGSSHTIETQGSGYNPANPINVYTFNPKTLGPVAPGTPYGSDTKTTQIGYYATGKFSVTDDVNVIAGFRVSDYESKNRISGITTQKESGEITPYLGLVYDLNDQYSLYASYTDIFQPQSNKGANGSTIKPIVGKNYETGIKGELFGKQLNVQASLYRLEQTNLAKIDDSVPYDAGNACDGWCYIAADKVISEGLELNANGEIASGWHVAAGYSYMHSEYASGVNKGNRYRTYQPRHSLRLANSYQLPDTNWTLGGNISGYSNVHQDGNSGLTGQPYTVRRGSLVLVDLHAKYQLTPKVDLLFVANNIFDRKYRANLDNVYYSNFGEPRNFSVNFRYAF